MESAMWSGLVLLCVLCVHNSFCLVLDGQAPQLGPCFVSCVCDGMGQITCNATSQFQERALEFNKFLFINGAGQNSLVHLHLEEKSLPKFLSQLPHVHDLSLAENNISQIQNDIFLGMKLRTLNLSHNEIETIKPETFQSLQYLQNLDLSHNHLSSLSKSVFSNLSFLEVLNLDSNQLIYFPFDAFSNVPRLQVLMLNENSLSYLMPGSLVGLTAVHILGLRNNKLQSFPVDVSVEMQSLKVLDVSGNPFDCSCALDGLRAILNSSVVTLMKSRQTVCHRPLALQGKPVSDVVYDLQSCAAPQAVFKVDSQSVRYITDMELSCDIQGDPDPAVVWMTPWGHQFADTSDLPKLENACQSCRQQRSYRGIGISLVSTVSVLSGGKKLHISNFRGYFIGNITCQAFNYLGNDSVVHKVEINTVIPDLVPRSMVFGGFCAAGFLCLGLLIGSIKLTVLSCMKRFGKKKVRVHTPLAVASDIEENQSLTEDTHCKEDSVDFSDEFYPPETPFTTPTAVSPTTSPQKVHTPNNGEHTPPGGWLPSNIMETMEEVRWRLRFGVGRKMETVKRNVQSMKETGIRNVQSIKESGSVYVHNIMESGSTAANKVKAGVVLGMETVKSHVQSIKEFCGTGDMGAQTISMISVETNVDTNETREVVRSITIV